jgi:4-hydroxybenzoate polyprenyltransferase/phosphoserine phosphatase
VPQKECADKSIVMTAESNRPSPPLCVDLDHTLLQTDLLFETVVLLFRRAPWTLAALPYWLAKGRAFMKHEIARRVRPDVARLPFREEMVEFLRAQKAQGRQLVLVSAADQSLAQAVEEHLQLFGEVIASNGTENVKGANKAKILETRFGRSGFDYVGDSRSDLAVWRSARRAFVVSDSARLANAVKAIVPVERIFPRSSGRRLSVQLGALRLHQWSKNLLVFVPLVTSHRILERPVLLSALIAFFSFGLFCSGTYLINDLIDLEADRAHPSKRTRALAAGQLSIFSAVLWAIVLLAAGVAVGSFCGRPFLICLGIYGVASLAYSLWIKRVVMLDVIVLACFYSLRLLAGGAATGIGCSEWLLAFSVFFFFGLALIKRYSELRESVAVEGESQGGRGYFRSDLDPIASFGVGSGMISVLVLVLYVMSPEVRLLYHRPAILLLLCPLFLYWITRIWFKAHRGELPQDPVVFALTDWASAVIGVLAAAVLYLATT